MSDTAISTEPSQTDHRRVLSAARLLLIALLAVIAVITVWTLPNSFSATQIDWQFSQAATHGGAWLSYEALVALVTCVELMLLGLYLVTALLLLTQPLHITPMLAALVMMCFPFTIGLAGLGDSGALASTFGGLTSGLMGVLANVGVITLVILAFVFPNGRFEPRWLMAMPIVLLLFVVAATLVPNLDDTGWLVYAGLMVVTILAAVVSQLARYRRSNPVQRSQSVWFLVAIISLVAWIVISSVGLTSPVALLLGYLPFALLSIGLVVAVWRGPWGPTAPQRQRTTFLAVAGFLSLASVAGSAAWLQENRLVPVDVASLGPEEQIPFVLDADMAMDDITALLYILQHPGADLRAITVNGVAFARCDGGIRNALGLLELVKAPDIPVACGRDDAYPGGTPAPDAWRDSADNLYGAALMTGSRTADTRSAAELLTDVVRSAPGEITVLAVGPLTNLAEAFEADPELPQLVKQIVIMGGAVDVGGNVANEEAGIDNQFAEWNFFGDPIAADVVFESEAPILLIPLDATNDVPFGHRFQQKLSAEHLTKPATFTYNLFYLNPFWLDSGMYWWDTLAVAAALDNSLVTLENATVDVITETGPDFGRTVRGPEGAPMLVATAADAQRFEALLLALLNRQR